MFVGEQFYYNDGDTYVTQERIIFSDRYEIPIGSIQRIETSAPLRQLDWWPWRRRRLKIAVLCFAFGMLTLVVLVVIALSSSDHSDNVEIALGAVTVLLWIVPCIAAVFIALHALLSSKPATTRQYYIIFHGWDQGIYRRWWSSSDTRDRVYNAINNARHYGA